MQNPSQSNQLTLFTEDSLDPANPSPWLVTGKDGTTIGSCGLSFRGWSERLARVGLWLRTYLESLPLPPMTSARIWSVSATASGFGILKLYLSGRRTGGRESFLWRTPDAGSGRGAQSPERFAESQKAERPLVLNAQVPHLYPTPRAADGITGALRKPEDIRDTSRLEDFVAILPTPTANDARCNGTESQQNRNSEALNVVAGGSLNPEWVEVLMGFPRGWTEIGKTGSPEQPGAFPTGWRD